MRHLIAAIQYHYENKLYIVSLDAENIMKCIFQMINEAEKIYCSLEWNTNPYPRKRFQKPINEVTDINQDQPQHLIKFIKK